MNRRVEVQAKLLVLGKDDRAFLAVVRSLGRKGHQVHIAWHDEKSLALHSRYVTKAHTIERSELPDGPWVEQMARLLERERFDLVVPTNDPSLFALHAQRARLEPLARLLFPNPRCMAVAFDKLLTHQLAAQLNLPVPEQQVLTSLEQARDLGRRWGWPIVLKPRMSFAFGRDKWEQQARKARSEKELNAYLAIMLASGEVLAQRHVDGPGIGIEVLARQGRVLEWFSHRRLHEPADGGASSLRISEPVSPWHQERVASMVAALELDTLAMFEFKGEPPAQPGSTGEPEAAGKHCLLEINARPWGSMPLALACGADFPAAWVEQALQGRHAAWSRAQGARTARNWTLDWAWARANRRAGSRDRRAKGQWFQELGYLARGRESSDCLVWDDPVPGLVELRRFGTQAFDSLHKRVRRQCGDLVPLRRMRWSNLLQHLAGARRVLFVCKGNLCRSPFAAYMAQHAWQGQIEFDSAGTHAESGKHSPRSALAHARTVGIELDQHRARRLERDNIDAADIVFVFDAANFANVRRLFPQYGRKLFYLGLLDAPAGREIVDPMGGSFVDYQRCFDRISDCLERARAQWAEATSRVAHA